MKNVADSHEWTRMKDMPYAIYGHGAIRLDTDVALVCGGAAEKISLKTCSKWHP